jgi:hypothetical protein
MSVDSAAATIPASLTRNFGSPNFLLLIKHMFEALISLKKILINDLILENQIEL